MPLLHNAIKSLRQQHRRTDRNRVIKASVRNVIKQVKQGDVGLVKKAYSLIDKAVKKNVIHKNAGGRYKSQVAKKLNLLTTPAKPVAKTVSKKTSKTKAASKPKTKTKSKK